METEGVHHFLLFLWGFCSSLFLPLFFFLFWELAYGREEGKMLGERLAKGQGGWWLPRETPEHV